MVNLFQRLYTALLIMGNNSIHWHILGAGSLGLLWAYHLNQNHVVTLITKNAQPVGCNTATFQFNNGIASDTFTLPIELANSNTPIKHLLICVKSHQTEAALQDIKHRVAPNASIVLLQNGLGNEQLLADTFAYGHLFKAVTTEAAKKEHQLITHTGVGLTQIGTLNTNAEIENILPLLTCALDVTAASNIETIAWKKLIVNCVINPLTVIYNCLNGELLRVNNINQRIIDICNECVMVARSCNIELDSQDCIETTHSVIHSTAQNSSSMREDYIARRSTEVDFINGFIVKKAKTYNLNTPINQKLLTDIKTLSESQQ